MISEIEYALMAGDSYISTRPEINQFPIPQGWVGFNHQSLDTGFEAVSFTNGTDIVISYAGTDPASGNDLASDVIMGLGAIPDVQLLQAAKYYLQVKADYTTATFTPNITFTGHSLGGGLASLMAVFFNESAVTFDQAPFRNSANFLIATELRLYLANNFPDTTYPQISQWLDPLDKFIWSFDPFGLGWSQDGLDARETKVTSLSVQGEFLSATPALRIGTVLPSLTHGDYFAPIDLHSQALLSAFLQSDQTAATGKALNDVTFKLTDLLGMIFDGNLFAHPTNDKKFVNFLEHLVRHQTGGVDGVSAGGDAMVTRFTADLWKLAQDGGLTMSENFTYSNYNNISKALIAFAMQKYYEENNPNVCYGTELFTDLSTAGMGSNGLQFDMANVSTKFQAAFDSNQKLNLSEAKGYQYFQSYLKTTSLLSPAEQQLINSLLPYMRDWYVQAGTAGMNATDTLNRGAFMLGGNGSDALVGGTSADLLVGNAGDDLLMGGQGNDFLLGGSGNDFYVYTSGGNNADGLDTIFDTSGQNTLAVDGAVLNGGAEYGDARVHRSADGHLYVDAGQGNLIVDGNIVIQNYAGGNSFGLTLSTNPVADPVATGLNLVGDLAPKDQDPAAGVQLGHDYLGNLKTDPGTPEPGRADALYGNTGNNVMIGKEGGDILFGSSGDDRLYGDTQVDAATAIGNGNNQSGSGLKGDWLIGGSGSDTLVGSNAQDVLMGGGGSDLLIGGAGNDDIMGDGNYSAQSFGWTVTDINGIRTFQPAEGEATAADGAADVIYAGNGDDHAWGGLGNDVIFGEAGDDRLYGNDGNDIILGGAESDILWGGIGNDYLDGGDGADEIQGGAGDDIIIGGKENDTLYTEGNDTIVYNLGDGVDRIVRVDTGSTLTYRFGAGIDPNTFKLREGSLLLDFGNGDAIHIMDFNQQDVFNSLGESRFEFSDGTVLNGNQLLARGFDLDGTAGDDTITGTNTTLLAWVSDRMLGAANDADYGNSFERRAA